MPGHGLRHAVLQLRSGSPGHGAVAHAATLESRVPFLHFFDGFRTSHEVNKIAMLSQEQMRALINMDRLIEHRQRALSPDHPVLRGTAQNPDVFFQAREAAIRSTRHVREKCKPSMDKFREVAGRAYSFSITLARRMLNTSLS